MGEISKNPIRKYEKGLPCMLGQVVGRIVGESDKGSWGYFNEAQMFSIPLFGTPHGTVVETGIFHLSEITEEGMKKLVEYEEDARAMKMALYDGRLD